MAGIRLASAIGEQREPIGILGGLDDAVNKTGDAIQAGQQRKSAEEAKKREQEQRLKDAIAGTVKIEPLDKAFPEEKKEYEDFATKKMAEYFVMTQDPKVTPSQLKKAGDDIEYQLRDRKNVYGRAYDAFGKVVELDKAKTHDTALFNNWFMGKENTQVANMPNDDFMAASEADRAGKMVGDNGMQATETKVTSQNVPYLNKSFEEKKKIDFATKADELVALKQPEITKAAQGYFGKDFKFDSYTKRTDKVSPTTGDYIFEFDEKQADLDAKRFASSMVGKGSFGDENHAQMQRALEYEALRAGNEAGFTGDKLANFVQEVVPRMAYDKFMTDAKAAEASRMKNDKDVTKAPSKGIVFNNTIGGGGENKQWRISSPVTVPVREGATNVTTKVKDGKDIVTKGKKGELVDYDFYSIETVATGENPKKINFGGLTDVQLNGVYKDKKTGEIKYVKLSKDDEVILAPVEKESDLKGLKNNVGEEDFDKFIGLGEYKKSKETKKAAPKEVKKQDDLRKKYKY